MKTMVEHISQNRSAEARHRSLWLQEVLGDAPVEPPLEGAARADVAIVGGGYVGLWTAIRIKEKDPSCDVVLLEQDICGGGASGRNGGMVLSWWPKLSSLVKLYGAASGSRPDRVCVHGATSYLNGASSFIQANRNV